MERTLTCITRFQYMHIAYMEHARNMHMENTRNMHMHMHMHMHIHIRMAQPCNMKPGAEHVTGGRRHVDTHMHMHMHMHLPACPANNVLIAYGLSSSVTFETSPMRTACINMYACRSQHAAHHITETSLQHHMTSRRLHTEMTCCCTRCMIAHMSDMASLECYLDTHLDQSSHELIDTDLMHHMT